MSVNQFSDSELPEDIERQTPSKRLKLNDSSLSSAMRISNTGTQNSCIVLYTTTDANTDPVT